jgi:hypothetical protein
MIIIERAQGLKRFTLLVFFCTLAQSLTIQYKIVLSLLCNNFSLPVTDVVACYSVSGRGLLFISGTVTGLAQKNTFQLIHLQVDGDATIKTISIC